MFFNRAYAVNALMGVMAIGSLIVLSLTSADAGVPDKEEAIGACITRTLISRGWTPTGSFVPWGEHRKIKFTYPNKSGYRANQTIYIYSVPSRNKSDVLVFGMVLQSHDGSDFEIARIIERECQVPFSAMMT